DPNKLNQPMIAFAIAEGISKIKADQRSTNQGKRSAVLAKNEHVSIVLAVLSRGEALHEHETEGQSLLQSYKERSVLSAQRTSRAQRWRFVDPSTWHTPLGGSAGGLRLRDYRVRPSGGDYFLMATAKGHCMGGPLRSERRGSVEQKPACR